MYINFVQTHNYIANCSAKLLFHISVRIHARTCAYIRTYVVNNYVCFPTGARDKRSLALSSDKVPDQVR